jgi:hypothetical protein
VRKSGPFSGWKKRFPSFTILSADIAADVSADMAADISADGCVLVA